MDAPGSCRLTSRRHAVPRAFVVELTEVACWSEDPAGGIYLRVADRDGGFEVLRRELGVTSNGAIDYVTLVHSRTASTVAAARAWSALKDWNVSSLVEVDTVTLIEQANGRWVTVANFPLRG